MARRLNRIVSIVLSAALVVLSAGIDAQRAAAQTFTGRVAPVSPTPQLGLGLGGAPVPSIDAPVLSLSAPALSAPSIALAAPVIVAPAAAAAALKPATPAAAIAEKVLAAAPALQALAKPETAGSAASVAGRDLENILTGAKSANAAGDSADAVAGVPSALTPALSPAAAPDAPKAAEVPAAAPAPFKSIASASSYSAHRLALKAVAVLTGAVFTLPQAGAALTAKVIASTSKKSLVLSDFDDTLAGYNEVLSPREVAAVQKIRAADKHFAVISDRGDVKRGTTLTVFESLESIPAKDRVGMYVAANSGGKVYLYDAQGVPQKVHEAPGLTDAQNASIKEAAAATKARLAEVGAVLHAGDDKIASDSLNTYGYAIMLKPGSSQDAVKGAARILNEELAKRGFDVEVQPRFAKSAENPPYATFSIITKADAAAYIANALKIEAKDALVIGDSMFIPRDAKKAGFLSRLGERLSGRPQAKTGNETDRNMAKNLPGVLTLGVGAAMDPRVPNGYALDGRGPDVTTKVLEAVASEARHFPAKNESSRTKTVLELGLIGLVIGGAALGFYALITAIGEVFRLGEEAYRSMQVSPDSLFYLGATTLGMVGMISPARPAASAEKPAPSGLKHAVEPNELYALALENITAEAAKSSIPDAKIKFLSAVHESRYFNGAWVGDEWRFFFGVGGVKGGLSYMVPARRTMITETMMDAFEPQLRGTVSAEQMQSGVATSLFDIAVKTTPDAALSAVDGVTRVSLVPRAGELWYSLQDGSHELASVNARTGEARKAAPRAPSTSSVKNFLLWLGGVALVAAIYGGFYWAMSHAPAAVPTGIPEGYNGPVPSIDQIFRGMGGMLGLGLFAGTLKRGAKKPKVTNEEVQASANSAISYKGRPWSQTEYNMGYYNSLESLKARGATKAQLALYEKLCADAPIKGGSFNPWSGD
jgi:hypothetical protein